MTHPSSTSTPTDTLMDVPFNPQPTLVGPQLTLRPMVSRDLEPLYLIASDPKLWEQHPRHDRHERPVFEQLFMDGLASGGALTAIRHATGEFVGSSRFYGIDAEARMLIVGYTFVARSAWGKGVNDEMKRLMLDHAFTWANRVVFHVAETNLRSRRAVEKLGARYASSEVLSATETRAVYSLDKPDWVARNVT